MVKNWKNLYFLHMKMHIVTFQWVNILFSVKRVSLQVGCVNANTLSAFELQMKVHQSIQSHKQTPVLILCHSVVRRMLARAELKPESTFVQRCDNCTRILTNNGTEKVHRGNCARERQWIINRRLKTATCKHTAERGRRSGPNRLTDWVWANKAPLYSIFKFITAPNRQRATNWTQSRSERARSRERQTEQ